MTGPPVVSVLVPARNAASTIRETLESVRRQTFPAFELILIDDGSVDGTADAVAAMGDPRFRAFRYSHGGLAVARNRGLEKARGEFVSFIDADDLWTPDKLESQVSALRGDSRAAAAYSWTIFVDERGEFLFAKEPAWCEGDVRGELERGFFIASGSNVLLRRDCAEALGGFDPEFDPCSDWEYMLRLSDRWPVVGVPRYQVLYRLSTTSMTSNLDDVERANRRLWQARFGARGQGGRHGRESLANMLQYEGFLCLSRAPVDVCRRRAARKLCQSVRAYPPSLLSPKTFKLWAACVCLSAVPASRVRAGLRRLLRMQGGWSALRTPELRRIVDSIAIQRREQAV